MLAGPFRSRRISCTPPRTSVPPPGNRGRRTCSSAHKRRQSGPRMYLCRSCARPRMQAWPPAVRPPRSLDTKPERSCSNPGTRPGIQHEPACTRPDMWLDPDPQHTPPYSPPTLHHRPRRRSRELPHTALGRCHAPRRRSRMPPSFRPLPRCCRLCEPGYRGSSRYRRLPCLHSERPQPSLRRRSGPAASRSSSRNSPPSPGELRDCPGSRASAPDTLLGWS
jgi:hypothetical protein